MTNTLDYIAQYQTAMSAAQASSDAEVQKIAELNAEIVTELTKKAADDLVVAVMKNLIAQLQELNPVTPVSAVATPVMDVPLAETSAYVPPRPYQG